MLSIHFNLTERRVGGGDGRGDGVGMVNSPQSKEKEVHWWKEFIEELLSFLIHKSWSKSGSGYK